MVCGSIARGSGGPPGASQDTRVYPLLLSVAVVAVVAPYPVTLPEAWTTHLRKQAELGTPSYINYINGHLKLSVLT